MGPRQDDWGGEGKEGEEEEEEEVWHGLRDVLCSDVN